MKTNKLAECEEMINDIKPSKQTDPYVILYLVFIYTAFSQSAEATKLLEGVQSLYSDRMDLGEQLFFSYVREGKLLKQQN
jgi:hypothetical protein